MTNVVALRLPDAELIALALRQFGYIDPDEIMELPEHVWGLAAMCAGLRETPNTAVRSAVWHSFVSPVATETRGERTSSARMARSLASLSEPAACISLAHSQFQWPAGSIS